MRGRLDEEGVIFRYCGDPRWTKIQAFGKVFESTPDDLDMHVIYDVSHNIAKEEEHMVMPLSLGLDTSIANPSRRCMLQRASAQ